MPERHACMRHAGLEACSAEGRRVTCNTCSACCTSLASASIVAAQKAGAVARHSPVQQRCCTSLASASIVAAVARCMSREGEFSEESNLMRTRVDARQISALLHVTQDNFSAVALLY